MNDELYHKKHKIAVFGSAGGGLGQALDSMAYIIGQEVANRGGIIITGDCGGFPYQAAKGAVDTGGLAIGFSPAMNLAEHIEKYGFSDGPSLHIFTGMGLKGRNLICTRSCDAAIFIAGRTGTLNEFTLVYDEGHHKVIGLLLNSGGVVDDIIIPLIESTEKPSKAKIVEDSDPLALVNKVFLALEEIHNSKKEEIRS